MTPRTLDWRSLQAKLRRIQDLLDDLRDLGPFDVERLGTDRLVRQVVRWLRERTE